MFSGPLGGRLRRKKLNMSQSFTVQDFFARFPDEDACLAHLMRIRFGERLACPKCGREGKFHRVAGRGAWECQWCAHFIYPRVGTPFEDSRTDLQKWFYAMFLFCASRHGVSAKELQRQLGVTYKCAWRMGHKIRQFIGSTDDGAPLSGHVEADEAFIGGSQPGSGKGKGVRKGKTTVFGMVERGGRVRAGVVSDAKATTLEPIIRQHVAPGSTLTTDAASAYGDLGHGYDHGTVVHRDKQWVKGPHHTNTIENFWVILKRSIRSTHISVSRRHLPKYIAEFAYRYNMRHNGAAMLPRLLLSF